VGAGLSRVTVPGTLIGVSCTAGPSKGEGPELTVPTARARIGAGQTLRILTRYRTDQFVGRTTAGNRASFYRTVATRPLVGGLNVPSVTAHCPGAGTEGKAIVTGRGVIAAVRHGAFRSRDQEDEGSEAFTSLVGRITIWSRGPFCPAQPTHRNPTTGRLPVSVS
jgi:hypothetical protein